MRPDVVYHITSRGELDANPGNPYVPDSFGSEGFVHCSAWSQVRGAATSHFAGVEDLVVLEVDTEHLGQPPVWEDPGGAGQAYPHIYSEVPRSAILDVLELAWDKTGAPEFTRRWHPGNPDGGISWEKVRTDDPDRMFWLAILNGQLLEDEENSRPMNRKNLRDRFTELLAGEYTARLLKSGDHIAGYCLTRREGDALFIRHFYIRRGLRRSGFGTRAFRNLESEEDHPRIELDVLSQNERAIRFWHSLGFADLCVRMTNEKERSESSAGVAADGSTASAVTTERIAGDTHRAYKFLEEGLRSFNAAVSEYHLAARRQGAITGVAVMLADSGGSWSGGVCGRIFWNWLSVDLFWIPDEYRGRGHGSNLLGEMEAMAREKGAIRSRLSTFSFQARGFYERHGYRVVGELKDYPPGSSMYWMVKDL